MANVTRNADTQVVGDFWGINLFPRGELWRGWCIWAHIVKLLQFEENIRRLKEERKCGKMLRVNRWKWEQRAHPKWKPVCEFKVLPLVCAMHVLTSRHRLVPRYFWFWENKQNQAHQWSQMRHARELELCKSLFSQLAKESLWDVSSPPHRSSIPFSCKIRIIASLSQGCFEL